MRRIVCYGDSNTWGYDALSGRLAEERWTRVLASLLGDGYEVAEEGLCGRTVASDDPFCPGLNGLAGLPECLCRHAPLDTLVVMLGTNDVKESLGLSAEAIAIGMRALVLAAERLPVWTAGPDIIVVVPPPLPPECESALFRLEMGRCSEKSHRLPGEFRKALAGTKARLLDASQAHLSPVDFVHLSQPGHRWLAESLLGLLR